MAKSSYNDIPNLNEDWTRDDRNGLPYSGQSIQKFIREQIASLLSSNSGKFGAVEFSGSNLVFRDEDGGNILGVVSLGGAVYNIKVESDTPSSFYVLASADSKVITMTPSTTEGNIGSSETHDFPENYTWILSVDSGNGFIERERGECAGGQSFSVDIRPYVITGNNKVRVYVSGTTSEQTRSVLFSCNVTSLFLTVNHTWQSAWIEGSKYVINGINFGGSVAKTLHVMIDGQESLHYTQDFAASVRYTTTAYQYDMTDKFPSTTGVHRIDIWMIGEGMRTETYTYNVICVKEADTASAKLVCINQVIPEVVNYLSQDIFRYATYGANDVVINISANDAESEYPLVVNMPQTVQAGVKNTFSTSVEIPTEKLDGVTLHVSVRIEDGNEATEQIAVNNKHSFPAEARATFYMNAALRSNSESNEDRVKFINSAEGASVKEYPVDMEGFSFASDAWFVDDKNIKCLSVQAGSSITSNIRPLSALGSGSMTLEFKMKTTHIADYDKPILSFMTTDEYDADTTRGVIVFPTKVMCLTNVERSHVAQSVNLVEDEYLHIAISFIRDYNGIGRNLCRIFVNCVPQCNFEYNGDFGNGPMRIGQQSADLYLYMLRWYDGIGFEHHNVLNNYLNTLYSVEDKTRQGVSADNNVIDGNEVSYDLVKRAGFNTMVIETGTSYIPDLEHTQSISGTSLLVEYAARPDWNFKIVNAPLDGQGTTSMKYARWNLRWKCSDNTVWEYPNVGARLTTTKSGWLDGEGNHPKVSKITAKKNIASSGQGHKMGATALYNDLYQHITVGIQSDVPAGARVAVLQYPVVGFLKVGDEYKFIGLYTIGADKGDSGTFGYDKKAFPDFLSLEGPNHAPLATRFIHPWVDVSYNDAEETLEFGNEEGWDVSACQYDTKKDKLQIEALCAAEWKPAYELACYCSPYLRSLSEIDETVASLNSKTESFRNGMDILGNRRNEVLCFYDANYKLVYYNKRRGEYVTMSDHDVRDYVDGYLENTTNPTTAQIVKARGEKFYAEASDYFNIGSACFHYCYCFLIGASDNDAKNTYPFKMKRIVDGGRWEWRQDDLDTILPTDNNGNSTKDYWIEHGDLALGVDIFQGSSSVFWTLIRTVFGKECKDMMMSRVFAAMQAIADTHNIKGDYMWQTIFNVFSFYFWDNSANYFPSTLYDEDTFFSYLSVWMKDPNAAYNGVKPLTQTLGTQYEAEKQWVLRRIIYTMSKFEIVGFDGSNADGLGSLEFTPAETFTFRVSPAIDLYPAGNRGGGSNIRGERTKTGETCEITATSDGSTTFYIKALDWLRSLGDLSGLRLTSRGGSDTSISFALSSKRMQTLKIGDEDASRVRFNANDLTITGDSFEEIDARNVVSLNKPVNLSGLPRLRRALFEGSGATGLILPVGAKVVEVTYPSRVQEVFLHSLPLITQENLGLDEEALGNIVNLYYYECKNLRPVDVLRAIMETEDNKLKFVTLISTTPQDAQASDISMLARLATPYDAETDTGYGCLVYNDETGLVQSYTNRLPDIQGTYNVPIAYQHDVEALMQKFPQLRINAEKLAVFFADPKMEAIAVRKWDIDGDGMLTMDEILAVTSITVDYLSSSDIDTFNEFQYFTNVTSLGTNIFNASQIREITLPSSVKSIGSGTFSSCASLKKINLENITSLGDYAFQYADLEGFELNCPNLTSFGLLPFNSSNIHKVVNLGKITSFAYDRFGYQGFKDCKSLVSVILPSTMLSVGSYSFYGCSALEEISIPQAITSIGGYAFDGCTSLVFEDMNFPSLTSIGECAFRGMTIKKVSNLGSVKSLPSDRYSTGIFQGKTLLTEVVLPNTLESIGENCFSGCASLSSINLPQSIKTISATAFSGCSSLVFEDLNLPNLTGLGAGSFDGGCVVKKISNLGNITSLPTVFRNQAQLTEVNIPSTLTSIGANCFTGCSALQHISMSHVTSVGNKAFNGCSSLEIDVNLPALTSIGGTAFMNSGITRVTNLGNITTVTSTSSGIEGVFYGCKKLTSVTLPSTVTSIGTSAFNSCTALTEFFMPNSVVSISAYAFQDSPLIEFNPPNNVLAFPNATGTFSGRRPFSGCAKPFHVADLGSITETGGDVNYGGTFYNSGITTCILPDTLITLTAATFRNCSKLATLICKATTPPSFGTYALTGTPATINIYVPDASVDAYKEASGWSTYASRIVGISTIPAEIRTMYAQYL